MHSVTRRRTGSIPSRLSTTRRFRRMRCVAMVPAGDYRLVVERGKTYHPHQQTVSVTQREVSVDVALKRWVNMAARGWFSGDLHLHRELAEIPNLILAEDLNVVFPLTNWVTHSDTPPSVGDQNVSMPIPSDLIRVDPTHVICPSAPSTRSSRWASSVTRSVNFRPGTPPAAQPDVLPGSQWLRLPGHRTPTSCSTWTSWLGRLE